MMKEWLDFYIPESEGFKECFTDEELITLVEFDEKLAAYSTKFQQISTEDFFNAIEWNELNEISRKLL